MQKIRASLSRLFSKNPSTTEALRIKKLERLHKKYQGKPFVFDEGNLRFMYFNRKSVQSAMKLDAPDELLCGYTNAMLAFLLVNRMPQHILMIGLGGGSLVKFCHRHLPACRITALEIDADVIALREQFMIPGDDDRLQIIHADATSYLKQNAMQVDVILLDGFDIDGLAEGLHTSNFYNDCHTALKPHGILVANMWGKRKHLVALLTELRTQFTQRVWWCRSLDSYNLLVFSFKAQANTFTSNMSAQAHELDEKFALNFTELCGQMRTLQIPASSKFNAKEDYEIRELARLTTEMAELMVTDEKLASNNVEWSEIHQ